MSVKQIKGIIEQSIQREKLHVQIHDTIAEIINSKYDGKKVSRRILADVKKALPEFTIHYSDEHGSFYIYLWGACGIDYDHRIGVHLCSGYDPILRSGHGEEYSESGLIYGRGFEYQDICHGDAAKSRLQKLESVTPEELRKVSVAIDAIQSAKSKIKELTDYGENLNAISFEISKLTKG